MHKYYRFWSSRAFDSHQSLNVPGKTGRHATAAAPSYATVTDVTTVATTYRSQQCGGGVGGPAACVGDLSQIVALIFGWVSVVSEGHPEITSWLPPA